MQRRGFLGGLAALYGAGAFGLCLPLGASPAHAGRDHANDWRWLQGNWNVRHRRLQERLVADTRWVDFTGTSAVWLTLGGLGTIDDNLMQLPGGAYRGLGVRAFDPASATWAIWWLDGRAPSRF
ncbi:twin-arginine translocation signal domain-containing protein [Stenotrophomonas indicatrix]